MIDFFLDFLFSGGSSSFFSVGSEAPLIACRLPRTEKLSKKRARRRLRYLRHVDEFLSRECSVLNIVTSLSLAFYAFILCSSNFLLSSSLLLKDVAYPHDKLVISMFRSRFLHTIYMFFACFIPILSCVLFLDLTLQISS